MTTLPSASTADRILDAAGRCFVKRGVRETSIRDVAAEAGCSRPTVYRWFADREAVRAAFVDREARRLGAEVAAAVEPIDEPGERLVTAILTAVAGVRADPALAAWFDEDGAAVANGLAPASPVIHALASGFLGEDGDVEAARWVVRITLSLLEVPGRDEADERAMLERFVVPVLATRARPGVRRRST